MRQPIDVSNVQYLTYQNEKYSSDKSRLSMLDVGASDILNELLGQYKSEPIPIDVSFRDIVGTIPVNELSHSIYPYPARLLRQIPRFFVNCSQLAQPSDVVLDPFCGSGTVLVEARAARLHGWGIDINPFARLLSQVKTTPVDRKEAVETAIKVLSSAKEIRQGPIPDVVNVDFWFNRSVKTALGSLYRAIISADLCQDISRYLLVCLAITAERCSLRDSRIPVPVRCRNWEAIMERQNSNDVWAHFESAVNSIAARLSTLPRDDNLMSIIDGDDAAQASEFFDLNLANKIKRPRLVITSPPYGTAQKYIRSTSLSIGWTGLASVSDLPSLDRRTIGRERIKRGETLPFFTDEEDIDKELSAVAAHDQLRAGVYGEYFRAMDAAIANVTKVLAPGGFMVLIAGGNSVANCVVNTQTHLKNLAKKHGMATVLELRDAIRGRVLLTKRASSSRPLVHETIYVLQKESK